MAAELKVGIGADNSGLNKGLQEAEAQLNVFVSKVSKIGQVGDQVGTKLGSIGQKMSAGLNVPLAKIGQIGEQLGGIGQKLSIGLTLPILGLATAAVKAYGDIEALQKGLESVMGSAAAAGIEFEKLREVAKLPGLGLKEAVKGAVSLQAAGFSADASRKSLLAFGNALATVGKGANEMNLVILALTQLQNKSSGFGQDLRQLTEQLPQLRGALIDAFGTMDTEAIGKMGVTGAQVVEKLTAEFEKLPKVTGGINNAFENLKDSMFLTLSRIGKIIDDNLDISGIIDKLTGYLDTAITAFENLSPGIQQAILVVGGLVAAAGPLLVIIGSLIASWPAILSGLGAISTAFTFMTGPIGLVIVGIAGIIAAVVMNWGKIKPYIIDTINYFRDLYNESIIVRGGVQYLVTSFRISFSVIKNILKTAWEVFKSFAKNTAALFGGVGDVIKGALTGNLDSIKQGLGKIAVTVPTLMNDLGNDLKKGFNDTFNEVGEALLDGIENTLGNQKLKPITDLGFSDQVAESITKEVKKGGEKAKAKTVKIELPDIEPIAQGSGAGFINFLGETYNSMLAFENRTREFGQAIQDNLGPVLTSFSDLKVSVLENLLSLQDQFSQISNFGNFLGESIATSFNFVTETIANSFSAIGEAMANGGNVMGAVGEAILGGIGSFLSDLGKQMIQYGIAALAMSVLSKMLLNPITAAPAAIAMIAAGAALSLIGGAIKGTLSGGGGGSVSSGTGASSNSYSSSFSGGGGMDGRVVFEISGQSLIGVLNRQQDKNFRLGG